MGDVLSRLMSRLADMEQANGEAHQDVERFHAPSECHGLVDRRFGSAVLATVRAAGFASVEALEAELEERGVRARWLHFRGPSHALGVAADAERRAK